MKAVHSEDLIHYNTHKRPTVILSHGKESGLHGEKIVALADVATSHGYKFINIDYRGWTIQKQELHTC